MHQPDRQSPTQQPLGFDYDEGHAEQGLTALAGIPVLLQAFRSLDLPRSVERHVSVKQRQRGLDEASYVESFLILNAAGGECLDDFGPLRQDGVRELIGHDLPSPEAARKFLYQFHDERLVEQAQQRLLPGQISYIPEENTALQGLGQVNTDLVRELARRGEAQKMATIDLDATVIESWKQEAQPTYQGGRGYQPMLALWAEMNLIVADEFRNGNVPALQEPLPGGAPRLPKFARQRDRVLLSRRFGLLRQATDELVERRAAGRLSARAHPVCYQRADADIA
jgi:hypothetical protein